MTAWLIGVPLGVFLGLNLIGLALSYAVIQLQPAALKIQERQPALVSLNAQLPLIGLNIAIITALTAGSLYFMRGWFVFEPLAIWLVALQVLFVSLVDDFFFYLIHRFLHENKTVYRRIHKIHHRVHTPVPIEYLYVHPLEWFMGVTGVVIGFALLGLATGGVNVWTFFIYSGLRQVHELHIHSGLKSVVGHYIPFWGTSEHHDMHHAKPNGGNYAATYTLWDRVFRTRASATRAR